MTCPLGMVKVLLMVRGVAKWMQFTVMPNLLYHVILGINFLEIWRAVVDYNEGWIAFKDEATHKLSKPMPTTIMCEVQHTRETHNLVLVESLTLNQYFICMCNVLDPVKC